MFVHQKANWLWTPSSLVHVSAGLTGHLSDSLQLLPLDLYGPEFKFGVASRLEKKN